MALPAPGKKKPTSMEPFKVLTLAEVDKRLAASHDPKEHDALLDIRWDLMRYQKKDAA